MLIITQLVKKFPAFLWDQGSLLCSQEAATGPYPEPDTSNSDPPTIFPYD
jgi:hypothetical protein